MCQSDVGTISPYCTLYCVNSRCLLSSSQVRLVWYNAAGMSEDYHKIILLGLQQSERVIIGYYFQYP